MGSVDIIFTLFLFLVVGGVCGVLLLLIWWLWRKITLPPGAPSPNWADVSALKNGLSRAPLVLRLVVVAGLGLLMSAPVNIIYDLIKERTASYQSVVQELSQTWGGTQLLIGPVLTVPYTIKYTVSEEVPLTDAEKAKLTRRGQLGAPKIVKREIEEDKVAVILPFDLNISGELEPELRQRGIYSVRVYNAGLKLSGLFKLPDFKAIDERVAQVHWSRAQMLVNMSDMKAFRYISALTLGEKSYDFVPGTKNSTVAPTGFSSAVDLNGLSDVPFDFSMKVGGSQGFYLAPIGVSSHIDISSPWPHPKYSGDGLPTRRTSSPSGFEAVWEVPNLVRNYPQFAEISAYGAVQSNDQAYDYHGSKFGLTPASKALPLAEYVVGVEFFEPVFHYSILTRAVKYALMFIALTFLSVLIFEVTLGRKNGARLHLAQYGIIGLGLCLFYLVLLTAAEQMEFLKAYILAAGVNIIMIGGYVRAALRRVREAVWVSSILVALYSALFFILRMEQYSLVAGTSLLVLATIGLMYATRNLGRGQDEDSEELELK